MALKLLPAEVRSSLVSGELSVPDPFIETDLLNRHKLPPSLVLGKGRGNISIKTDRFEEGKLSKVSLRLTQGNGFDYAVERKWLKGGISEGRINFPNDSEDYMFDENGDPPFELYVKKEGGFTKWYVKPFKGWTEGKFRSISLVYTADRDTWNPALAQDARGEAFTNYGDIHNGFTPGPSKDYPYPHHSRCEVHLREDPDVLIPVLPDDFIEFRVGRGTVEEGAFVQIRF